MRVTLICVGKLKETYLKDATEEYLKRISKYSSVEVIEVADEKLKADSNNALDEQVKLREAERILKFIDEKDYLVALAIEGKMLSSIDFSFFIQNNMAHGVSNIKFVIGGSLGLHASVVKRANYSLSFSKMTFPHQLMRVILLEQVYRAFRIAGNEPYHK